MCASLLMITTKSRSRKRQPQSQLLHLQTLNFHWISSPGISDRSAFSQITGTRSGYFARMRSASDLRFSKVVEWEEHDDGELQSSMATWTCVPSESTLTFQKLDNTTENLSCSTLYDGYVDWKSPAHLEGTSCPATTMALWHNHFLSPKEHQYTQDNCMQLLTKRVFFLEWFAHIACWCCGDWGGCDFMLDASCQTQNTSLFAYFWRCCSCEQTVLSFSQKFAFGLWPPNRTSNRVLEFCRVSSY